MQIETEEIKLSLFVNGMTVYVENSKKSETKNHFQDYLNLTSLQDIRSTQKS